jgi:hypothetical protein
MDVAFGRVTSRVKAKAWPLGAARSRLFQVLRHLGLRRAEIEVRMGLERAQEIERRFRVHAEAEAARLVAEAWAARLVQQQEILEATEARKAARRLEEARAFERMNDEQRAAWRMDEAILGWLTDST